jgi:hypothetical protein
MSASQICPSCGAASPADAQFCRDCGAILVRSGSPGTSPKTPLGSDPTFTFEGGGPASPQRPDDKRSLAVGVIVIVVILLALGAYFFRKQEPSPIPVPGESPTEAPTEAPADVVPTEAPRPPRREPTLPPLPPLPPPPPREPESLREPNVVPPESEPEPEPDEYPPAEPPVERPRPREPERRREPERTLGWYRMKFRAPLFQSPSETAPIITYLRPGTRIRVTRVVPGFLSVESTTGKAPGWVSSDDADPEQAGR